MTVSSHDVLWRPLYYLHWGMTQTDEVELNASWKMNFLKRKTEVLMQQMKEGRSYAKRKKNRTGGDKTLSGPKPQLQRSTSGLGSGWFKRPISQMAETKENKKVKAAKNKREEKEKELDRFLQQRAKFFDQFSEVDLPTTFIV